MLQASAATAARTEGDRSGGMRAGLHSARQVISWAEALPLASPRILLVPLPLLRHDTQIVFPGPGVFASLGTPGNPPLAAVAAVPSLGQHARSRSHCADPNGPTADAVSRPRRASAPELTAEIPSVGIVAGPCKTVMKSPPFADHALRANGRGMLQREPSAAARPNRLMLTQLFLWLFLASGAAPSAPAQTPVNASRSVSRTVRSDASGNTQVESHSTAPGDSATRSIQSGQVVESTWHANARVIIQIQARPVLDRMQPGTASETSRQLDQLSVDLETLDARLRPRTPSQVTRRYQTLFSGVAATVDSLVIGEIRRLPNVAAVYQDVDVHANDNENGPMIGAPTVWSPYGVGGAGVKVAVIDPGIDYTHPDLGGCFGAACKVVGGYDFVNHDNDPSDDNGHGTHVAGIIAANGVLKGIAPGATLLAYKVLNQNGSGFTSDIIAGIEQALADGATVANLSLGGQGDAGDPTSQAIDNATAAGMLSVVAAGNSGPSYLTVSSPGTARTALTVGAVDKSWALASFSSRGYVTSGSDYLMKPEVVAPGVNILSTVPASGQFGNPTRYASLSGTSMATPHVAGSAALLLEWKATLTPQAIKNRLARSGHTPGQGRVPPGAGGIDLGSAFGLPILLSATNGSFRAVERTTRNTT